MIRSRLVPCLLLAAFSLQAQSPAPSVQERSAAVAALFHEMWEERLKRSPEFASALGDRRYNDQLHDLSPRKDKKFIALNCASRNKAPASRNGRCP